MTQAEIDKLFEDRYREASTIMRMDQSHDETRNKLHKTLTQEHRSAYDGSDYEEYPHVHDVFGDHKAGTVVYSQGGQHYAAPYDDDGDEGYNLGEPTPVERAYVPRNKGMKESEAWKTASVFIERYISQKKRKYISPENFAGKGTSFPIDKPEDVEAAAHALGRAGSGNDSADTIKSRIISIAKRMGSAFEKKLPKAWRGGDGKTKESSAAEDLDNMLEGDLIRLREGFLDDKGIGKVRIITPGQGTTAFYPPEVLQEAAKDRVFPAGTKMFLDHDTPREEMERPEGSVLRLAAKTTGDAEYQESGPEGPGLYAPIQAYPEFREFIESRAADIGNSIIANGQSREGTVNGVKTKIAVKLVPHKLNRIDFVSTAGRGGGLVKMYESYRGSLPQRREEVAKIEIEESELKTLRESAAAMPKLQATTERLAESLARFGVRDSITERLGKSGLPPVAQKRVLGIFTNPATIIPMKESLVDVESLNKLVDSEIESELAYLRESGARVTPVKVPGSTATDDKNKPKELDEQVREAEASLAASVMSIGGFKAKEKAA